MADEDLIIVARVVRSHGLQGALRVAVLSDNPNRFRRGASLLVVSGQEPRPAVVERFVSQGRYGIIKLFGVDTVESAQALRGAELAVRPEQLGKLPSGCYYTFEIIGLEVVDGEGKSLGRVSEVETMPAGDIYRVTGPGGDFYLPAVGDIIKQIDVARKVMVIDDREGLR